MMQKTFVGLTALLTLATMCASSADPLVTASQRRSDVVVVTSGGATTSAFCSADGKILVVHGGYSDANGSYQIGQTLLVGERTYRLQPGNATIEPGCYDHRMAYGGATGTGRGVSTVWYVGHPTRISSTSGGSGLGEDGADDRDAGSGARQPTAPPAAVRRATPYPVSHGAGCCTGAQ